MAGHWIDRLRRDIPVSSRFGAVAATIVFQRANREFATRDDKDRGGPHPIDVCIANDRVIPAGA